VSELSGEGDPREWPLWWGWSLELTAHLLRRMIDRDFTEVQLRAMLEEAKSFRRDFQEGRWIVETIHHGKPWEIIVEPDESAQLLVIVTAYSVG